MLKWIRDRITSAHVIALIALFVALGGSVYAATQINGARIKKNSEPGNRLKNDTVTGKQVKEASLSVPAAYGHVGSDGTLSASKKISATSLYGILGNYYCIDLAPGVQPKNVVVTPDAIANENAVAHIGDPFTSCAPFSSNQAKGDITVQTFDADSGSGEATAFWILVH